MATSQDPLTWRRQFCKGQWKEQEGEEDRRRDGKITSRNGREWGLEIPWGQRKTREGWKGIVAASSVVPRRPPRLRDWDEMRWCHGNYSNWEVWSKMICLVEDLLTNISAELLSKYLQWDSNKSQFSLFPLQANGNLSCHSNQSAWGRKKYFFVNRKPLSLCPFVASFKTISTHFFFMFFHMWVVFKKKRMKCDIGGQNSKSEGQWYPFYFFWGSIIFLKLLSDK